MKACGEGSSNSGIGPPARVSQPQITMKQRQDPIPIAMLTDVIGSRRQNDEVRVRATTTFRKPSVNAVTALSQEEVLKSQNRMSLAPRAFHASNVTVRINRVKPIGHCNATGFSAIASDFRLIQPVPRCVARLKCHPSELASSVTRQRCKRFPATVGTLQFISCEQLLWNKLALMHCCCGRDRT